MKVDLAKHIQQIILMIGLIIIGAVGRYILFGLGVQPFPNFEIIMVMSFIAVVLLRSPIALFVPLCSMVISDILIGNPIFVGGQMNKIVLFTYSGFALIAVVNIFIREKIRPFVTNLSIRNLAFAGGLGMAFVLVYDVWTNFGWWYLMYPHTPATFTTVYLAGIPFMIYHLISGLITFVLVGVPIVNLMTRRSTVLHVPTLRLIEKIPVTLITIVIISLAFTGTATKIPRNSEVWLEKADATSVRIVLIGDSWTLEDQIVASTDETVFSLLARTLSRHDMTFEYTYYQDFNANLIETIHTTQNGDGGNYWQYWVDGELPMVGADHFDIKNSMTVEWRFESVPT